MFVLVRAVTWATLFMGFVLVAVPRRILSGSGVQLPSGVGPFQIARTIVCALGTVLAVACILTFVFDGKGTPMPFDPPRRLVVRGPYRWLRNPMYLGAATAMAGAALYYQSWALFAYVVAFLAVAHFFVLVYEEPTLRRMFDGDYDRYCAHVHRWRLFRSSQINDSGETH